MAGTLIALRPYVTYLIGLAAVTGLIESLLPKSGLFRAVRVGIGVWYLAELMTQISVILSDIGG